MPRPHQRGVVVSDFDDLDAFRDSEPKPGESTVVVPELIYGPPLPYEASPAGYFPDGRASGLEKL